MKKLEDIKSKELQTAAKAINESGLLGDVKIRIVGTGKEALLKDFTEKFDGILYKEGSDDPDPVATKELAEKAKVAVDFYNAVYSDEGNEPAPEPEPEKKEEAKTEEPKKRGRPKKEKAEGDKPAEPKEKKPRERMPIQDLPRSRYGHLIGTQAAAIDDALWEGGTLDEIAEKCTCKKFRIQSHLKHIKDKRPTLTLTETKKKVGEAEVSFFKIEQEKM